MPSQKRRINLTVSEEIYQRIQLYKASNGLYNDATACLQLVVQQLNSQEQSKAVFDVMRQMSTSDIQRIGAEGLEVIKQAADEKGHP